MFSHTLTKELRSDFGSLGFRMLKVHCYAHLGLDFLDVVDHSIHVCAKELHLLWRIY